MVFTTSTRWKRYSELEKEGKGKGGVISVNQLNYPWLPRTDMLSGAKTRYVVEAYSPLVRGKRMEEKVLQPLTKKYGNGSTSALEMEFAERLVPLPRVLLRPGSRRMPTSLTSS